MTALGVLGGTFDPPHFGHLILAEQAREQLSLERVLWVPAADPPHKQRRSISPVADRVEMLSLAVAGNDGFAVSTVDVGRPGPHYTADMLALLTQEYPGAELSFLVGGDSFGQLLEWRDPQTIVALARLAVMQRPGASFDPAHLEAQIPGLRGRFDVIHAPLIAISGADIRARVAAGRTIRYLMPPAVEAYVHERGLFLASQG